MKQLCAILLAAGLALAAGATREIQGRVVDAQTGTPIPRARVTVTFYAQALDGQQQSLSMWSDEGGAFDVKNVPDRPYQITCQRPGYLQDSMPEQIKDGDHVTWAVRMSPQVVIEGVVVDEKGAAVPYPTIQVYRQAVVEGRRQPQLVSGNPGDDAGNFRVWGLKADRYWIGVTVPPRPKLAKVTYGPVFYPNSPDMQGAELMNLGAGEHRHLRIRLQDPVPAREIRGTVAGAGEGVNVALRMADPGLEVQPLNVNSQWDARTREFRISGVAPGQYILDAMTTASNQQLMDSLPLTVGEHDISGIRMQPRPPAPISGLVKPAGLTPQFELRSRQGRFGLQPDAQGNLVGLSLPPGTYRLALTDLGPVYLRSAWQAGRNVLEDGLLLSPDGSGGPLEIEVGGPGGTIEGSLPESKTGVVVALFRRAANEMMPVKEWRGIQHFKIEGVPPGDYLVFGWQADAQVAYAEPDFLQEYGALGKEIAIKGPEKIQLNLDRLIQ